MSALPWYGWVLIAACLLKPLFGPFLIGREIRPRTATDCFLSTLFAALYIWAIWELGAS